MPLDRKVKDLDTGQKQLVEIVKALVRKPKFLVLDEPTSSLTEHETDLLLLLLDDLRSQGVTCIYISHKLDEVMRISDTVTVLRDGKTIISAPATELTKGDIIRNMVGREMRDMSLRVSHMAKEVAFEIVDYSVEHPDIPGKMRVENISIQARRGEILGVSGLVGAGRTELFSSVLVRMEKRPRAKC